MIWPPLATQFCLELACGTLLALACVHPAPVGRLFYRLLGTTAILPLFGELLIRASGGMAQLWRQPVGLCVLLAVLGYPLLSGGKRPLSRLGAMVWTFLWSALGLALSLGETPAAESGLGWGLATLSALSTGAVAGGVGLAMVLGHWYLTVPNLAVEHLRRLNLVTGLAMVANLLLLGASILVFGDVLEGARTPLLSPWGMFHLGTRLVVGLILPLAFALMVRGSLVYGNTRSATGILYASTVLVLIGTALALSLQDSYGVPL
ncbi:MAG: hypothetical protein CMJ87_05090 [Planctomycetes bacterium]|nr:hypothetical protein [Planctomycetota bacterium]